MTTKPTVQRHLRNHTHRTEISHKEKIDYSRTLNKLLRARKHLTLQNQQNGRSKGINFDNKYEH